MQYGIQRRAIYLAPASDEDRAWMFDLFETEEVWSMFGFEGPGKQRMIERYATGALVIGIIRRVEGERRIGFTVSFPPQEPYNTWEFGVVIPDPKERDAFSAIAAGDATAHYMFDHCRIDRCMWRIREDNAPSEAIARRMGFRPYGIWEIAGHKYSFYRMDRERWANRYAKLDRGEETNPSGLEDTFVMLEGPPYTPKPVTGKEPDGSATSSS